METNMTNEKALDILERHNLWRRGAEYVEATDPKLLGMALDKAIEVLRSSDVVEKSDQLPRCQHKRATFITAIAETYCPECREIL